MRAFLALVRKDLVIYFSDKRTLAITLAAPILIAAFFGAVLGGAPKKPSKVPVAVVDQDASPVSKAIVASMKGDGTFALRELPELEAVGLVRQGKVRAAVVIPAGFGEAAPRAMFAPGAVKPDIVVHYDPSQAMALPLVKGLLAEHVMKGVSRSATATTAQPAAFSLPFGTREREVTGRANVKYNAYSHSFAGMGVQFVLFMGIEMGVGILLMRRMGLWKRLRAAPLSRGLLLSSRIAAGTLIAGVMLAVIYAGGIAFFGVRVEGSWAGFAAIVVAFSILTSAFGLLIAALGRTPEATRGLAVLATLILVMLGGAWVPAFVFPEWLQAVTLATPTRWAMDGLEAMTWRGLGFEAALAPVGAMLAFAAVFAAVAVRRFDWEE